MNIYINRLVDTNRKVALLTGAFSALGGAAGGYIVAMKQLESKYARMAQEDIDEVKQHYKLLRKEGVELPSHDEVTPEEDEAEASVAKIILEEKYSETEKIDYNAVETVETTNAFDRVAVDNFDYELELPKRSADKPYIITVDEFLENETAYTQATLTYYEENDVLIDEGEQLIGDIDTVVGRENLERFGYGSNSKTVVYVRNDKTEIEFEIIQTMGDYAAEVLGFIEHSDGPRNRRFRGDDE